MREKHGNMITLKNLSGVYEISIGSNIYIGSSKNLYKRYIEHLRLCKRNMHYNALLQDAYNKIQSSNFKVLEFCNNTKEREQYYMDMLLPELNICKDAHTSIGYKHKKEIIDKLKVINKEIANRPEVKQKTKATQFKKGHKLSEKTIAINKKRMSKQTIDLETGVVYDSLKEACESTNKNRKTEAAKISLKQRCRFQYV